MGSSPVASKWVGLFTKIGYKNCVALIGTNQPTLGLFAGLLSFETKGHRAAIAIITDRICTDVAFRLLRVKGRR